MNKILIQQMRQLEKQEQKMLNQPENSLMKTTVSPFMDKIQNKIPVKLKSTLDTAFYKGFQLVFEKGSSYIEKTYNKDKIEMEYDINNYAVDKKFTKRHFKKLDKQSGQSGMLNSTFSILEGGVLGLLGIGLPDIPLFLSVIVKTIYEISLSYGYQYNTAEEKTYILLLICGAITKGEKQKEFDRELELLGEKIDQNIVVDCNTEKQMKVTAGIFSDALITAKFIQGIPIVGVIGGVVNYSILNRVSKYTRIKYKKRYLQKKIAE